MSSKLVIAGAGSGKSTWLIKQALQIKAEKVLITTFTEANEKGIIGKFFELNGCVPANVTVMTWFSFLLKHGVRPYQSAIYNDDITGMILVNRKSGFRFVNREGRPVYYGEKDGAPFYFTAEKKIYSDKIAKFVVSADKIKKGLIINRIRRIFPNIFVDEVQDLAGYDLEIIHLLNKEGVNLLMVGDPRQVTYHTHDERKNKQYSDGNIKGYVADHCKGIEIDEDTLCNSYRNNVQICEYANMVYPKMPPCLSHGKEATGHDGIFLVSPNLVKDYIERYHPIQLRDKRTVKVSDDAPTINFGDSKGLTYSRVLIYPTNPIRNWIKDPSSKLEPKSRARLYVAITRAEYSVAFVDDSIDASTIEMVDRWNAQDGRKI